MCQPDRDHMTQDDCDDNALLNLPGMSEGTITVVDLESEKVIKTIDTLKDQGLNPNSIVLLPEWNHLAGH